MAVKIELNKNLQRLLASTARKGYPEEVRKEFSKRGPTKVKQAIVQDMIKGISPVQGGGKYKKYSETYKQTISGVTTFRRFGGKVVPFDGPDQEFIRDSSPTKQLSPVNLRHSGELHKSLKSYLKNTALVIAFQHFLADIHNRRGAGKAKVVRRMLPTEAGEKFNRTITAVIISEVKKAVTIIAKQFS